MLKGPTAMHEIFASESAMSMEGVWTNSQTQISAAAMSARQLAECLFSVQRSSKPRAMTSVKVSSVRGESGNANTRVN